MMKNNIVFLHSTQNYSYQFSAANSKVEFMAKGLTELGNTCYIHNGIIGCPKIIKNKKVNYDKIATVITYSIKNNKFVSWLLNIPYLYSDLKQIRNKNTNNWVVLTAPALHYFLVYVIISRILKYKIAIISHEWIPTTDLHFIKKILGCIYAYSFGYFADVIFPISEYIIRKVYKFGKPYIKVPVLADFSSIPEKIEKEDFFTYCVYAKYTRVIFMIIESFKEFIINNKSNIKLILILSGSDQDINNIYEYILRNKIQNQIIIKSQVPYKELLNIYKTSQALIIPLDPQSDQDKARFSQKIAEYCSSASPIITNDVGEVKYYFKDKQNAIICDYSVQGFLHAFKWVVDNRTKSNTIGYNGYKLGSNKFNYKLVCKQINEFINSI